MKIHPIHISTFGSLIGRSAVPDMDGYLHLTTHTQAQFSIGHDATPGNEGWAYSFIGTSHDGDLVTASGPIDNTRDLFDALTAYAPADYDLTDLPSWGPEPSCTADVYSWDETHRIVGCVSQGLQRVPRDDA
jgi:hypothetical protein